MAKSVRTRRVRRRPRVVSEAIYIVSFGVKALFGSISYREIKFAAHSGSDSHLGVIFGDNGAGKTTLLHLLYAALSTQENAGLRGYISRTPFRSFHIRLSNGMEIEITKTADLVGIYKYKAAGNGTTQTFEIHPEHDGTVREQRGTTQLQLFLENLGLDVLFVDHERYVRSTYAFLSDASYPENPYYAYVTLEGQSQSARDRRKRDKSLQFPLMGMIEAVNGLFRSQAFRQGSAGDVNASSVYLEIVRAIARKKKPGPSQHKEIIDFEEELRALEKETESYIAHGLLSNYPFEDILQIYHGSSRPRQKRIEEALVPFIASVSRRIAALNEIHSLMMMFENEINSYLSNKIATVHALDGVVIRSGLNVLTLDQLSSGEKQLLFLLSAAIVSRGSQSLILIDEPELSLNYKWQRKISQSLAALSSSRSTQFIMATHSIEIITKFSGTAFELENEFAEADA